MRIALLTRNFSRTFGGAESYAIAIASELAKTHEVHVFCQQTDRPVAGAVYHRVQRPCQRPRWINQIYFALMTWWLTRRGFDVVHSHEHVFHGQIQTLHVQPVAKGIWGQRTGWRKVLAWLGVLSSPRRMTYLGLEKMRMRIVPGRRLVFTSPQLMADFLPFYPGIEPISHLIAPGVQMPGRTPQRHELRQTLGWNDAHQWLLFVANDYRRKGLDTLLQALTELPRSIQLVVVGQTRQQATYAARAHAMGLTARVHFLGPRTDVSDLMVAADALAHPTLEDSFGMVVLEAMAHGLPVVVSPAPYCGLASELTHLQQAWILVDPQHAGEVAQAVRSVLTDAALRRQLVEGGCAQAGRHSWADATLKYIKVFSS